MLTAEDVVQQRQERKLQQRKAWASRHPSKMRVYRRKSKLRHKYKMDETDYERMVASQSGNCAIHGGPTPAKHGMFDIDHCHKTGKVRGLLCNQCNALLGFAQDNIEVLRAAIAYLEKHRDV